MGALRPENNVRVVLTSAGSRELASTVGDSASALSGSIVRTTDAGLTLSVSRVEASRAAVDWRGEQVTIPLTAIDHTGVRQFDRTRSVIAAAGITAVTLALRAMFLGSEGAGGNTGAVAGGAK